jgi:hypothetical protein
MMNTRDEDDQGPRLKQMGDPNCSVRENDSSLRGSKVDLKGAADDFSRVQHGQPQRINSTSLPKLSGLLDMIKGLSTTIKVVIVAIGATVIGILKFGDAVLDSNTAKHMYGWYVQSHQLSEMEQEFKVLKHYIDTGSDLNAKDLFRMMSNKYDVKDIRSFLSKSANVDIRRSLEEMGVIDNARKN